jgi:hypothetical protein
VTALSHCGFYDAQLRANSGRDELQEAMRLTTGHVIGDGLTKAARRVAELAAHRGCRRYFARPVWQSACRLVLGAKQSPAG